jgi:putative tryptophan/tyrosine transport system substrate-binding protein
MSRRSVAFALLFSLLAAPLAADAQPAGKVPRIGVVIGGIPLLGFVEGLRDLGYVDGRNIVIEYRAFEGRAERFPEIIAEFVRLKVDVIISSSTPAVKAAKEATSTIPIVMAGLNDPVGAGLVASLSRPGGNVTGLTNIFTELSAKRLELLKETVPGVARVAVLWNSNHPGQPLAFKQTQVAAQALGVTALSVEVRRREDFESAFRRLAKERPGALLVLPDPVTMFHRKLITDFDAKNRLPAMYAAREWADAGGLMSYGTNFAEVFRRAATYVDKILKGAKPADLPVEQPTKFELAINLKTAKVLGLTIPPSVLARADRVIA